jgi:hypothetical protein
MKALGDTPPKRRGPPAVVFRHSPSPENEDWTCGLVACSDVLSTLGFKTNLADVPRLYDGLGLSLHSFGTTIVHLGALLQSFDLRVRVSTSSKWLHALGIAVARGRRPLPIDPPESREALECIQRLWSNEGRPSFRSSEETSFENVWGCVSSGGVAILCVSARRFYGLPERWNHYVIACRGDHRQVIVLDRMCESSVGTGTSWKRCLETAAGFDWMTWRGDSVLCWRKPLRSG